MRAVFLGRIAPHEDGFEDVFLGEPGGEIGEVRAGVAAEVGVDVALGAVCRNIHVASFCETSLGKILGFLEGFFFHHANDGKC